MAHDEDFLAFDIGRDLVERPRKSIIVSVVAVPFAVTDSNGIDGADGPGFGGYFIQEGHDVCLVRDGDIEAVHAFKEGFDGILRIHPGDRKQVVGAANAQFSKNFLMYFRGKAVSQLFSDKPKFHRCSFLSSSLIQEG